MIINHINFNKSITDLFKVDSLILTDDFSFRVLQFLNEGLEETQLQEKILELETKQ